MMHQVLWHNSLTDLPFNRYARNNIVHPEDFVKAGVFKVDRHIEMMNLLLLVLTRFNLAQQLHQMWLPMDLLDYH